MAHRNVVNMTERWIKTAGIVGNAHKIVEVYDIALIDLHELAVHV
jgi:hypothetical protein